VREFPGYSIVVRGELLTLSRLPVVAARALPEELPGADWRTVYERTKSLRTDLRVGDRTVSVYNVHIPILIGLGPSAFSTATGPALPTAAGSTGRSPTTSSATRTRCWSRATSTPARRWASCARCAAGCPTPSGPTAGSSPRRGRWRARPAPAGRLDWALATPSVAVHEYTMLDPGTLSDHRPTRLTISLRGSG